MAAAYVLLYAAILMVLPRRNNSGSLSESSSSRFRSWKRFALGFRGCDFGAGASFAARKDITLSRGWAHSSKSHSILQFLNFLSVC